jgi:hypothetical protein
MLFQMKYIYLFLLFSCLSISTSAQDFPYAAINADDINLRNTRLDSNANAMVINEHGAAIIRLDTDHGYLYVDYESIMGKRIQ